MKKQQLTAYLEYNEDRFTKRNVFKEGGMHAFVLNFQPGQELPPHTHPGAFACLHVLKGKGTFTINQKEITAEENDILFADATDEIDLSMIVRSIPACTSPLAREVRTAEAPSRII